MFTAGSVNCNVMCISLSLPFNLVYSTSSPYFNRWELDFYFFGMFSVTLGESRTNNMGEVKVGSKSVGGGIGIRRKVKLLPPLPPLPLLEWYLTTEEQEEDRGERDPSLGQFSSLLPPFGHFFLGGRGGIGEGR